VLTLIALLAVVGLTRLGFPVPELGLLFLVLVVGSAYTEGRETASYLKY
jgi:hypothetical protein